MKKFFRFILILLGLLLLSLFIARTVYNETEPQGKSGDEAELLTQKMFAAIDKTAWDSTAWVQWSFRDKNHYLWDKKNDRVRVRWDNVEVLLDTKTVSGTAKKDGVAIVGADLEEVIQKAWSNFCNDSFWLNAPAKAMDEGTERTVVELENGKKGLKVSYLTGGVTPGDSYLWELDDNGLPSHYKMWVKIIPVGGAGATWENWITLPTGAKISTFHKILGKMELPITNVDGGMIVPEM